MKTPDPLPVSFPDNPKPGLFGGTGVHAGDSGQVENVLGSAPPLKNVHRVRHPQKDRTDDLGAAVDLINEVRASWELDLYTGAMTEDAVMTQLRYERSAELWIQAHALNDLRRFNDPSLDVPPGRGGGLVRDRCWEVGEDEYQINANLSGS